MKPLAAAALAALLSASAARAQYAGGAAPAAPGIINMSLMEALVAIRRPELAGVFAFVPDAQSSLALADLLLRDRDALKRFLKKNEKDVKDLRVINQWDKEVCLHIVAATAGGAAPLAKGLLDRVSRLSLADGMPLQFLVERRAGGRR